MMVGRQAFPFTFSGAFAVKLPGMSNGCFPQKRNTKKSTGATFVPFVPAFFKLPQLEKTEPGIPGSTEATTIS